MIRRTLTTLLLATLLASGCATNPDQTGDDKSDKAIAGAVLGALVGGILGNNTGKQSTEKTILAVAAGAAVGGAIGHSVDEKERKLKQIATERDAKEMEVERLRDNLLRVSVSSEASFAFGKAEVKPEFKPTLNKVANVLMDDDSTQIEVVGHTDNVGSETYNQRLSEERAAATVNYLIGRGVAAGQIAAAGRGELEPRADNTTEAGRAQNRRVEIYLLAR